MRLGFESLFGVCLVSEDEWPFHGLLSFATHYHREDWVEYTTEIYDLITEIAKLKGKTKRNGTKIYYAEKRLERLKTEQRVKSERKTLPQKRSPRKRQPTLHRVDPTGNRAYVLSCESHDLIQAILALENLRKG